MPYYIIPNCTITSASTATDALNVWSAWNATATNNTSSYSIYEQVLQQVPQVVETPEECAARAAREQAARERWRAERQEAQRRAAILLREHLTHEQIEELMQERHFRVQAPSGIVYRIDVGYARNVRRLDETGRPIETYCIHPADALGIPEEDSMLAQKLMLETSEADFLRIANRHPADAPALSCSL